MGLTTVSGLFRVVEAVYRRALRLRVPRSWYQLWAPLLAAVCSSPALAQTAPPLVPLPPVVATAPEGFTQVTSIRELNDSVILLADAGENRIYLIDWEGGLIRQVGREGDGPGEYRRVGWLLSLGGDSTLMSDAMRPRWELLAGTALIGTIHEHTVLPEPARGRLWGSDASGRLLAPVPFPGQVFSAIYWVVRTPGLTPGRGQMEVDTIATVRGEGPSLLACIVATGTAGGGAQPMAAAREPSCNFMPTRGQARLFPDGWIAVAHPSPYRVDWYAPSGAVLHGDPLDSMPLATTESERCAALGGWSVTALAGDCDRTALQRFRWPEEVPAFLTDEPGCRACSLLAGREVPRLLATPQGELVVRRTPSTMDASNRYDVVDRGGVLVGRIILPLNEAIVEFTSRWVYSISTDEFGLQWLRRHEWNGR